MRIRWSKRAAVEFADTAAYVADEFGVQAAVKIRNTINEAVGSISQFPDIGKVSFTDEETGVEFRELTCRLNSVIYTVFKEEIYIVSIWCNRQDRAALHAALRDEAHEL